MDEQAASGTGGAAGADAGLPERLPVIVLQMERRGVVSRTFRRLDPDRQYAVIAAVLSEAAETGPGDLSMRAVAQRAGVAVGSLYQYFPGRSGMVAAAAEIAGGLLAADLARYRDDLAALPLREGLITYVAAGVQWSSGRPDLLRFFARAAYGDDPALAGAIVTPVVDELRAMVRAILDAAVTRGEIAAGVDLEAAARFVHGLSLVVSDSYLLPGMDAYFRQLQGAPLEARVAQLADFVIAALGGGSPGVSGQTDKE